MSLGKKSTSDELIPNDSVLNEDTGMNVCDWLMRIFRVSLSTVELISRDCQGKLWLPKNAP